MLNRQLGSYTIVAPLGMGGMGEVYRAHDSKLGRDVAIKILPEHFTADPERRARFAREARVLATLNHPNIAAIYGLEESNGMSALVLELVDGTTLADRIARGPLRLSQAVTIAQQVVSALQTAHEQGIVHRDLKPANVMLQGITDISTTDIRAKVLDFGLAKPATKLLDDDPTISVGDTAVGHIVGTPAYMSPEQARGLAVDARTDVWAFGCVLYEMIVGRPAFRGATTSDTIAKVLERDPDWQALPASAPASIRRLLTRCLEKDPKRRLHAIADANFELDEALTESKPAVVASAAAPQRHLTRWLSAAGVIALVLAAGGWKLWTNQSGDLPAPRVMPLTSFQGIEMSPTFSPDGKQVAFSWDGEKGDNENIYVLIVGSDNPLAVTSDPARDVAPAWRPGSSDIAFARVDADKASIFLVSATGGSERKLAEFTPFPYSGSGPIETRDPRLAWSPDGHWLVVSRVVSGDEKGIFVVGEDGSKQTLLSAKPTDDYRMAVFSPDGSKLGVINGGSIEVADLAGTGRPTIKGVPRTLTSSLGYVGGVAWTVDGESLMFGRSRYPSPDPPSLWRVSVSGNGVPERFELAGVASYPAIAPTGSRLAFVRRGLNIDLFKLEADKEPQAFLASTFNEQDASFSNDGSKIAFATDRTGEGNEIWVAKADGSNRRPLTNGVRRPEGAPRWSPKDDWLAFDGLGDDGLRHVYLIDPAGGQIRQIPSKPGFRDQVPSWSRDGKWIYFGSTRSGRPEVWRASSATGGDAEQITRNGGEYAFESWDGHTLYYLRAINGAQTLFAMPLPHGAERPLNLQVGFWNYVPVERGLYYMPPRLGQRPPFTWEVRFLNTATGQNQLVYSVPLATASPGLTVTKDGKTVVIEGVSVITQDLMRIENFR
jgi:Tol biopolymer transport system component